MTGRAVIATVLCTALLLAGAGTGDARSLRQAQQSPQPFYLLAPFYGKFTPAPAKAPGAATPGAGATPAPPSSAPGFVLPPTKAFSIPPVRPFVLPPTPARPARQPRPTSRPLVFPPTNAFSLPPTKAFSLPPTRTFSAASSSDAATTAQNTLAILGQQLAALSLQFSSTPAPGAAAGTPPAAGRRKLQQTSGADYLAIGQLLVQIAGQKLTGDGQSDPTGAASLLSLAGELLNLGGGLVSGAGPPTAAPTAAPEAAAATATAETDAAPLKTAGSNERRTPRDGAGGVSAGGDLVQAAGPTGSSGGRRTRRPKSSPSPPAATAQPQTPAPKTPAPKTPAPKTPAPKTPAPTEDPVTTQFGNANTLLGNAGDLASQSQAYFG